MSSTRRRKPPAAPAPTDARSPTPAAASRARARRGDSASMLASVPPEVNTTLRGSAPTSAATCSRAVLDQPARGAALGMDRRRIAGTSSAASMAARASRPQRRGRIVVEIGPRRSSILSGYGCGVQASDQLIILAFRPGVVLESRRPRPSGTRVAPRPAELPKFRIVLNSYVRPPLPSSAPPSPLRHRAAASCDSRYAHA